METKRDRIEQDTDSTLSNLQQEQENNAYSPEDDAFSTIDSSYYSSIETPDTDPSLTFKLDHEDIQMVKNDTPTNSESHEDSLNPENNEPPFEPNSDSFSPESDEYSLDSQSNEDNFNPESTDDSDFFFNEDGSINLTDEPTNPADDLNDQMTESTPDDNDLDLDLDSPLDDLDSPLDDLDSSLDGLDDPNSADLDLDSDLASDPSLINDLNDQMTESSPDDSDLDLDLDSPLDDLDDPNSADLDLDSDLSPDPSLINDLNDQMTESSPDDSDLDLDLDSPLDDLDSSLDGLDDPNSADLDLDSDLSPDPSDSSNESFFGDLNAMDNPSDSIDSEISLDQFDTLPVEDYPDIQDDLEPSLPTDQEETSTLQDAVDPDDGLDLPSLDIDSALTPTNDLNDQMTESSSDDSDLDLDLDSPLEDLDSSLDGLDDLNSADLDLDSDLSPDPSDSSNESFFGDLNAMDNPSDSIDSEISLDQFDTLPVEDYPDIQDDLELDPNEEEIQFNPDGTPKNINIEEESLTPLSSGSQNAFEDLEDLDDEEIQFNPDGTPKNTKIKEEDATPFSAKEAPLYEDDDIDFNPDGTPKKLEDDSSFGFTSNNNGVDPYSDSDDSLQLEGLDDFKESDPFYIEDENSPDDLLDNPLGDTDFSLDYSDDDSSFDMLGDDQELDSVILPEPKEQTQASSFQEKPQEKKIAAALQEPLDSKPKLPKWKTMIYSLGSVLLLLSGIYVFFFTDRDGALKRGLAKIQENNFEMANSIFDNENPSVSWYNKYAKAFMDKGNYDLAQEKLLGIVDSHSDRISKGAYDISPNNKETLINIAKLLVHQKHFEQAFATTPGSYYPVTLNYLKKKYPQDYDVLDTVAQSYVEWGKSLEDPTDRKNKFDRASEIYNSILRAEPKNTDPFSRLLEISLLTNDRLEERLNQMRMRGLESHIHTDTLAKIILYYLNKDQLAAATTLFNRLLERKDSDSAIVFQAIGKFYAASYDFARAEENLIKGIRSNSVFDGQNQLIGPKDQLIQAQLSNDLGQIYVTYINQYPGTSPTDLKQRDRLKSLARYHYNQAKRYDPNNPNTFYLSGNLQYAVEKNYSNAILDFEKAYTMLKEQKLPIPSDLSYNLGNSLYKKENYDQALNILSEVRVRTQLQFPSLEYLMGMTYMKLGVNSEAIVKLNHTLDYLHDSVINSKTSGSPRTLSQNRSLYLASIAKNNIGAIYQKEGAARNNSELKNQARSYFFQALDDASHINPQFKIAYPSLNLQDSLFEDNLNFVQNFGIQGRDPLIYDYTPDFIGDFR